ncbi:MAG: TIGR01459 family HAD-type hydrolase [Rhodobacteraceae bacterium]|nr:TIGR01459 family HAD-type hydrolase [Paracoccaceae bacterium]
MQNLTGLSEVAARYDGILFDIYGVIHNGEACFPGAIDSLQALKDAGIPYAFLSNMPRLAARVRNALIGFGMPEPLAVGALTSGEAVFRALSEPGYGKRYYFQGPERTREIIPGGYETAPIEAADFVVVSGIGDEEGPEDYRDMLDIALARGLPMICANPDLRVGHGTKMVACAGLLVDAYERMGGDARWMGKPHKAVFDMAGDILGGRLLMVGDSLRTDITGAAGAGLDTVFIKNGIHTADIAEHGEALFAQYGIEPSYTLPRLVW